jgi:hypothetical protein
MWDRPLLALAASLLAARGLQAQAPASASASAPAQTQSQSPSQVAPPAPIAPTGAAPVVVVPLDAPAPIAPIPDPVKLPPAQVPFVNPLYRAVDVPAKLLERPGPEELASKTMIVLTLKLSEKGQVLEAHPVEPCLNGLGAQAVTQSAKWTFEPAKKNNLPVATWTSFGFSLDVVVEKGEFSTFGLVPVGKADPLQVVWPEAKGDKWLLRYPREVLPPDTSVVSVEDVDVIPSPKRASWRYDDEKMRSRVTAYVEVGIDGKVSRLVPTAPPNEGVIVDWVRKTSANWKFSPAQAAGRPVASWLFLDATLEYEMTKARETAKRSFKKNLRGPPKPFD